MSINPINVVKLRRDNHEIRVDKILQAQIVRQYFLEELNRFFLDLFTDKVEFINSENALVRFDDLKFFKIEPLVNIVFDEAICSFGL